MSEFSGFWTTTGAGTGDQVAGYTQAHWAKALPVISGGAAYEGVIVGLLDALECVGAGANKVNVKAGGAIVDGKWYHSDNTVQINIPSSTAGNTRVDLIVVRATWASNAVRLARVAGTQGANPVAPALTRNSGSVYEIPLAEVTVTSVGAVTIKDARAWSFPSSIDGSLLTPNSISLDKLTGLYDIAYAILYDTGEEVEIENDFIRLYVPDVWDGKKLVRVWARVDTAGGSVEVKVKDLTAGTTLSTTTIADSQTTGVSNINQTLVEDNELSISVTNVGAGTVPVGLHVQLKVEL